MKRVWQTVLMTRKTDEKSGVKRKNEAGKAVALTPVYLLLRDLNS